MGRLNNADLLTIGGSENPSPAQNAGGEFSISKVLNNIWNEIKQNPELMQQITQMKGGNSQIMKQLPANTQDKFGKAIEGIEQILTGLEMMGKGDQNVMQILLNTPVTVSQAKQLINKWKNQG